MNEQNRHGARVGMLVLYTRDDGTAFPAVVASTFTYGAINACAFTPAPEPVWQADYSATPQPRTWRHLDTSPSPKGSQHA